MKNPTEKEIYQSYNEQFKSFQLTWNKYFHYGIFDITSDFISAQQRTIDIISQLAKISSSHLVLDVGCGIGSTCIYLAKTIGCKMYGIDPAVEQIKFAGERSKYENIQSKIDFKEGKAESIPFDEFTFDVVMSNEVFCHLSDKKKE